MTDTNQKKKRLFSCLICPVRSAGLFTFPCDPKRKAEWLKACGFDSVKIWEKICFMYFQPSCFQPNSGIGKYRLWDTAVPTLKLPLKKQKVDSALHDHDYSVAQRSDFLLVSWISL